LVHQIIVIVFLILTAAGSASAQTGSENVPRMSVEDLNAMLDSPDLLILDVRTGQDWTGSEFQIKGAQRKDPRGFEGWVGQLPMGKRIVLYCT
jgi:predicted sulfurtransferase